MDNVTPAPPVVIPPADPVTYEDKAQRAVFVGESIPAHDETVDLAGSIGKQLDAFRAYVAQVRTSEQADAAVLELLAAVSS